LLGIGAFSCLVRFSVSMLRYYDKQAVLIPAYTDPDTAYRYYAGDQIRDAVLVRSLRDAGFTMSAIAAVVPQAHDPRILRRALQAHRRGLLSESSLVRRRLADLIHLVDNLTEVPMTDTTVTTIPATTILALRGVVPTYAEQSQLWDTFAPLAQRCDLPARPETGGSTFFDEGYQENDVDLEAWVPIGEPITVEAPLTCRQVPQYRAAVAESHSARCTVTTPESLRHRRTWQDSWREGGWSRPDRCRTSTSLVGNRRPSRQITSPKSASRSESFG
jgi:DNA-binding transcriptional MerR regulator